MNENNFYVYYHVCPQSGQIVYVGKGKAGRAWNCDRSNFAHDRWLKNMVSSGYLPTDWVKIPYQGLSEVEAYFIESVEIYMQRLKNPILFFNSTAGCALPKELEPHWSEDHALEIARAVTNLDG